MERNEPDCGTKAAAVRNASPHARCVRQYRRSLAILECGRGKAVNEVAQSLHVTRQGVHNWVIRFHHAGQCAALADRPHSGRPRRAEIVVDTFLCELMLVPLEQCGYRATHWTVPLLQDQFKQHLNQVFCNATVRRVLHRLGYVWKRPRYVLAADPQREKKRHIGYVLGKLQRCSIVLVEDETDLLHCPGTRKAAPELEGRCLQPASLRLSEGGRGRGILMPEVRPDRRKRASPPEKEVGKRRRSCVAVHIQTLGSLMTPKSRVIRGARMLRLLSAKSDVCESVRSLSDHASTTYFNPAMSVTILSS